MRRPAALPAFLLLIATAAVADDTRVVRKQLELRPDGRVTLDTFKGTVQVKTWSHPKVEIVATIAPDPSGEKQQERVELTEVRIGGTSGRVEIESDYSEASRVKEGFLGGLFGISGGTMPFINYEIQMPATTSLEIEDHKSDMTIAGLAGDLSVETHKGSVKVTGHAGGVRVDTHKGDIDIDFATVARPVRIETHKGTVTLRVPTATRFDVEANLDDDAAEFRSDFPMTVTRTGSEGSVRAQVNGGGPAMRLETHKGSISIVRK